MPNRRHPPIGRRRRFRRNQRRHRNHRRRPPVPAGRHGQRKPAARRRRGKHLRGPGRLVRKRRPPSPRRVVGLTGGCRKPARCSPRTARSAGRRRWRGISGCRGTPRPAGCGACAARACSTRNSKGARSPSASPEAWRGSFAFREPVWTVRVRAATIAGYQTVLFPDHIESLAPMQFTGFTTPPGSSYAQFTMDGPADRVDLVRRAAGDRSSTAGRPDSTRWWVGSRVWGNGGRSADHRRTGEPVVCAGTLPIEENP
jgi:hypothetical protein